MQHVRTAAANSVITVVLVCGCANALADNCHEMADLAFDAAKLRDAGVPLAAVEARLRQDVQNTDERMLGLEVARLVYQTRGTAHQLNAAMRKKCKVASPK